MRQSHVQLHGYTSLTYCNYISTVKMTWSFDLQCLLYKLTMRIFMCSATVIVIGQLWSVVSLVICQKYPIFEIVNMINILNHLKCLWKRHTLIPWFLKDRV